VSGCDIGYEHEGGFYLCQSEQDWLNRAALMRKQFDEDLPVPGAYQMIERADLERLFPGLGPSVVGGVYCRLDGAVNPPRFFKALHSGYQAKGGLYRSNEPTLEIRPRSGGYTVTTPAASYHAPKVVLAAGLANGALAPQVGMTIPVRPVRGQIMVTQKMSSRLRHPTHTIRQLGDGTIIFGDSYEEVGQNDGTDPKVMSVIARRAIKSFPFLAEAQVLRAWGGLRTMTADGFPLYMRSPFKDGAYGLNVHSGVTLAPVHASALAAAIANDTVEAKFPDFARVRP
jgi:glycine/D-amino acid oxidase-like deaminating enzyme